MQEKQNELTTHELIHLIAVRDLIQGKGAGWYLRQQTDDGFLTILKSSHHA